MTVHRLLFAGLLLLWTWLLVKPNPVPAIVADSLLGDAKHILSKCLHFGCYAFLAWYGTVKLQRSRWRWVWLGLAVHGVLSELAQHFGDLYYQTHRSGRVYDVLIDTAGIALGAWWRIRTSFSPSLLGRGWGR